MKTIVISGRVGRDAELRRTQGGDPVLGFTVAVDDGWGDNKRTLWFKCSLWGKRGESLKDMLPKGREVTVSGDLSTEEYQGKTQFTIRVGEVKMHGPADRSARSEQSMHDNDPAPAGGRDMDDEIPF